MKGILVAILCAVFAFVNAAALAQAQQVPPGATIVAKVRFKPLVKNITLFEVNSLECPSQLKTAKGRQKFEAALRREMGGELCRSLPGPAASQKARFTYCRGGVVFAWTVSAKTCRR